MDDLTTDLNPDTPEPEITDLALSLGGELSNLLVREAEAVGLELKTDMQSVAVYIAERTTHLSLVAAEPGFAHILTAERDNIALFSASAAVDSADSIDARVLAVIQGGIGVAVRALLAI